MRDEQRWLEHLGDPRLCTRDGKSTQATASVRCMSPLKSPSDEPAPRSPPESLSAPTETASPISPPGDPYYETPVFTPEYVDTPTPEQEPNHIRTDHYEEICTVSSDSSYSSYTSSSPSIPATKKSFFTVLARFESSMNLMNCMMYHTMKLLRNP